MFPSEFEYWIHQCSFRVSPPVKQVYKNHFLHSFLWSKSWLATLGFIKLTIVKFALYFEQNNTIVMLYL